MLDHVFLFLLAVSFVEKGFCHSKHEGWLGLCLASSLGLRTRARVVARIPVYVSM